MHEFAPQKHFTILSADFDLKSNPQSPVPDDSLTLRSGNVANVT